MARRRGVLPDLGVRTTWGEAFPNVPAWKREQEYLGGSYPAVWAQAPGQVAAPYGAMGPQQQAEPQYSPGPQFPQYTPPNFYGWSDFGEFQPSEFQGVAPEGYDALQQSLFAEQMAMVSGDLGRRGVLSSSGMEHATVGAAAQAQRTRFQLETAEQARRTQWGLAEAQRETQWGLTQGQLMAQQAGQMTQFAQTEAARFGQMGAAGAAFGATEAARRTQWEAQQEMQQWRERESAAQREQQMWALNRQISTQRAMQQQADRQQFVQTFGSLPVENQWRLTNALMGIGG